MFFEELKNLRFKYIENPIYKCLISLIQKLSRIEAQLKNDNQDCNSTIYEDLAPKDDLGEEYFQEIHFAIKNKRIKNIALSGPYGAGKSSVIKTYQNKNIQYKYLNISLAHFDSKEVNSNQIEKNILKQIFYKVKNNKMPFSRYKRIHSFKINEILKVFLPYVILIITGFIIFKPSRSMEIINSFKIYTNLQQISMYRFFIEVCFLIFVIVVFIDLARQIKGKLKINKVNLIKDVEISANDNIDNSVFNKEIDEILYFFEVNKYDVVVLEDIDRFNNIDIFVKLRELNELINNSEQINRKVTFIYAIKDDMFEDGKIRTKFFDFIVPIIPVTNSSNSIDIITKKLEKNGMLSDISDELINDVTLYVDDMRLIINICNEFIIYKNKLGKIKLKLENLFAMIVYKNIYPEDFALLQFNQGIIGGIFENKGYLSDFICEIDKKCESIKEKINLIDKEYLENIDELKAVYLEYLNVDKNKSFYINNVSYDNYNKFKSCVLNLDVDLDSNIRYEQLGYGTRYISMRDLSTNNNNKQSYYERYEIITYKSKEKKEELKKELETLKDEKKKIKSLKVKEIIKKYGIENIVDENVMKKKLIVYLVRNGYIDEMYNLYTTYFYEGSLSNSDMEFVTSIKNEEALDINYNITNVPKIMDKLHLSEFNRPEVLNTHLVDYIIQEISQYKIYYDAILNQLTNMSDDSIEFIDNYLSCSNNSEYFIKTICSKWKDIWNFIENRSNYSEDKKDDYLLAILKYGNLEDIISINKDNLLSNYISNKYDFIRNISSKLSNKEKLMNTIKELDVKFTNLDTYYVPIRDVFKNDSLVHKGGIIYKRSDFLYDKDLTEFIYNNNLYEINFKMIKCIITLYSKNTTIKDLETSNYTTIKESECEALINYIDDNIDLYLQNVLLELNSNIKESEKYIIALLKNERLSLHNREKLINKQDILIYDITEINEKLLPIVVREGKLIIDWFNIVFCINSTEEVKSLTRDLLNKKDIYEELSNKTNKDDEIKEDKVKYFCMYVIANNDIPCISFLLTKIKELCDNYLEEGYLKKFVESSLNDYDKSRIHILIEHDLISLNIENYNILKRDFSNEHIYLLERNILMYLEASQDYELSLEEFNLLMDNITNEQIKLDLEKYTIDYELQDVLNLLEKVFNIVELDTIKKIVVLNYFLDDLEDENIINYLQRLGVGYTDIINKDKLSILANNEKNIELLEKLKGKFISSYNIEGEQIKVNMKRV